MPQKMPWEQDYPASSTASPAPWEQDYPAQETRDGYGRSTPRFSRQTGQARVVSQAAPPVPAPPPGFLPSLGQSLLGSAGFGSVGQAANVANPDLMAPGSLAAKYEYL